MCIDIYIYSYITYIFIYNFSSLNKINDFKFKKTLLKYIIIWDKSFNDNSFGSNIQWIMIRQAFIPWKEVKEPTFLTPHKPCPICFFNHELLSPMVITKLLDQGTFFLTFSLLYLSILLWFSCLLFLAYLFLVSELWQLLQEAQLHITIKG